MLLKLSPRLKSLFIVMAAVLPPMGAGLTGNRGERSADGSGGLVAEPATLDFGSVEVGMDKILSVTASNATEPGAEAVTFVRDGPALGIAFAITGGDCAVGSVLEPGDNCTVEITFAPDSAGVFEDTLTLETDDEQSASVMLHGTAPQGPVLAFNPLSLGLGEVPVGTTSEPQNATLTNTGDSDATGLDFTASGGGDFFDADTTDCGDTLPVGENCQVVITFTPPGIGLTFAALTAEGDEGATARLNLMGEGDSGHGGLEVIFSDRFEQARR